ncbi:hypothetical protein QTP88_013441 [Uroleucon formosanum]
MTRTSVVFLHERHLNGAAAHGIRLAAAKVLLAHGAGTYDQTNAAAAALEDICFSGVSPVRGFKNDEFIIKQTTV